eukprot:gb/GECH01010902.1/.p1 GENE.gb/GECH01010902.1/~~gb/GECH01010902.1/.p1  ORF type:complete len:242 (+),score=40.33 gb/GECH01010902.1/:1-726(+)
MSNSNSEDNEKRFQYGTMSSVGPNIRYRQLRNTDLPPVELMLPKYSPEDTLYKLIGLSWFSGVLAGNTKAWWNDYTLRKGLDLSEGLRWSFKQAKGPFLTVGLIGSAYALSQYYCEKENVTDLTKRSLIMGNSMGLAYTTIVPKNKPSTFFATAFMGTVFAYTVKYYMEKNSAWERFRAPDYGLEWREEKLDDPVFGVSPPDLPDEDRHGNDGFVSHSDEKYPSLEELTKAAVERERREYS